MRADNTLTRAYLEKHPAEAARVLENFPYAMSAELLSQLPPDRYLAAFQHLTPSYGANLLQTLAPEQQAGVVDGLPAGMLSLLLPFFDTETRNRLLGHLSADSRATVVRQRQYPLDTVGTIMGPPSFSLPDDISVGQAIKRIKNSRKTYPNEIFILNRSLQYLGVVTLDRLIKSPSSTRLGALIDATRRPLSTRKNLRSLADDPLWSTSLLRPVTDSRGLFVGTLAYAAVQLYQRQQGPPRQPAARVPVGVLEMIFHFFTTLLEGLLRQPIYPSSTRKTRDSRHDHHA